MRLADGQIWCLLAGGAARVTQAVKHIKQRCVAARIFGNVGDEEA